MRHVLVMSGASAAGLVAMFAVDMVDMYFLTLLGEQELAAAVGFAGTLLFFVISVSIGLQIALGALEAPAVRATGRRTEPAVPDAEQSGEPLITPIWTTVYDKNSNVIREIDPRGIERVILSAIEAGANDKRMAAMLFGALTDHRYIDVGHPLDFTNKAFEALDVVGWDRAAELLPSLAGGYARAMRMEENNAWRHPIDLVKILDAAFERLPEAYAAGHGAAYSWDGRSALVPVLLAIVKASSSWSATLAWGRWAS